MVGQSSVAAVKPLADRVAPQAGVAVGALGHLEQAVDALAGAPIGLVVEPDGFERGDAAGQGGDAHGALVGDEAHGDAVDCVFVEGEVVGVLAGLVVDADDRLEAKVPQGVDVA